MLKQEQENQSSSSLYAYIRTFANTRVRFYIKTTNEEKQQKKKKRNRRRTQNNHINDTHVHIIIGDESDL